MHTPDRAWPHARAPGGLHEDETSELRSDLGNEHRGEGGGICTEDQYWQGLKLEKNVGRNQK